MTNPAIAPPPELRNQWREQAPRYRDGGVGREEWLIDRASQWGYEQRGEVNEAQLQKARDEEPEPKGPTVMEIIALADEIEAEGLGQVDLVRRALSRWGRPSIEPVTDGQT